MRHIQIQSSSFRDPCGFLFYEGGRLRRQVNKNARKDYDRLMGCGLYDLLCSKGWLITHSEIPGHKGVGKDAYKVIEPDEVNFISYPYEWSFSQLKDAALVTLNIQKAALKHKMTLKDASAFNIQFHRGRPVFIDTLSFERYRENQPWAAYRQFSQHFLAPLALMRYTNIGLNQLMKIYLDGIPLDLAVQLLPFRSKWNLSLFLHLHTHAKVQKKYGKKGGAAKNVTISYTRLLALIQNLTDAVNKLKIRNQKTEWADYYRSTNYSDRSFAHKKEIIAGFLEKANVAKVWDVGANTGEFTRIASQNGIDCVAFDLDPLAVDAHYQYNKKHKIENTLPLIMDVTNPSASIGWDNAERMGIKSRPLPDVVFALALIHHLSVSNNIPFYKISDFFCALSENLFIEFVPKSDSQVQKLLASRKDIFYDYNEEAFVREFEKNFQVIEKQKIAGSERSVFWMKRRRQ